MRIFGIIFALTALAVAAVTTFMQVQPALFFIELLTGSDNKFPATLVLLLTALVLMLPVVPIVIILKKRNKKCNEMPDTTGKSGIIVHRKRTLSNGIYDSDVLVNGEFRSSVSNGKSTFIELLPGATYKVAIKGQKSAVLDVEIDRVRIVHLQFGFIDDGGLKVKVVFERLEDVE